MRGNQRDAAPKRQADQRAVPALDSAAQVIDYLRSHPNFLVDNPSALDLLYPPRRERGDQVIDLQQFMVERLRAKVCELDAARDALIATGRGNLAAQDRVHRAILTLLQARSFEHLIELATTDLAIMLDLDVATLGVELTCEGHPPTRVRGLYQLAPDTVDKLIGRGRHVALRRDIQGTASIFGAGAGLVASEALIRLEISPSTPPAMLSLGSRRGDQFHPGQSTELLTFLGKALASSIRAWLNLPG